MCVLLCPSWLAKSSASRYNWNIHKVLVYQNKDLLEKRHRSCLNKKVCLLNHEEVNYLHLSNNPLHTYMHMHTYTRCTDSHTLSVKSPWTHYHTEQTNAHTYKQCYIVMLKCLKTHTFRQFSHRDYTLEQCKERGKVTDNHPMVLWGLPASGTPPWGVPLLHRCSFRPLFSVSLSAFLFLIHPKKIF